MTVDDLAATECFPCINEVIPTKLMTEISDHIIDVDTIVSIVEKRRTCAWYEPFENFYNGILQVANMQSFFKEHSAGFHTAEAKGIWKEYTESYYRMDTYYRLFHLSFQKSLETSNILLDDLFKHVVDKVEGLYTHWFLGEQWLLLTRMIPLVENNFNLCELGPRSTGKSHLYKEISPNSILVSGGQTTVANLFYNMGHKTVGLVGLWDCVAFDEVAGIRFKDKDGVQIMKDYMASGSFARGKCSGARR